MFNKILFEWLRQGGPAQDGARPRAGGNPESMPMKPKVLKYISLQNNAPIYRLCVTHYF